LDNHIQRGINENNLSIINVFIFTMQRNMDGIIEDFPKMSPSPSDLKKRSIHHGNSSTPSSVDNSRSSIELNEEETISLLPISNEIRQNTSYPSLWLIFTTGCWSVAAYTFILSPFVSRIMGTHPSAANNQEPAAFSSHTEYEVAIQQSYGFFTDIPTTDWLLMKDRIKERQNHWDMNNPTLYMDDPRAWYQNNFEPDFTCAHERRVGGMGDGPKWVCDPHRIKPFSDQRKIHGGNGCLVYSVGSQGNFEFEIGLMETMKKKYMLDMPQLRGGEEGEFVEEEGPPCEVHIFDPADYSGEAPPGIHYHAWGLKSSSDTENNEPNFKTVQESVAALGHEGRVVDIFKIDCEGCEWQTYRDWFDARVTLMQILVEVHNTPPEAIDFFETMQSNGYVTFHKEPNTAFGGGLCQEYALLKLGPDFFN